MHDELPTDPDAIYASVTVTVNHDDKMVHTHEDGSEHELSTCTMSIENHGFPNEKFVEALLLAAQSCVAVFFREEVIKDTVPPDSAEKMSMILARKFIAEKVEQGDYPEDVAVLMIPAFMPVSDD
jgi:hypothetical protein